MGLYTELLYATIPTLFTSTVPFAALQSLYLLICFVTFFFTFFSIQALREKSTNSHLIGHEPCSGDRIGCHMTILAHADK